MVMSNPEQKLDKLPKSAQRIYKVLCKLGQAKPSDLVEPLGMPPRTIRHGLNRLVLEGLAVKIPNLEDLRSNYFKAIEIDKRAQKQSKNQ